MKQRETLSELIDATGMDFLNFQIKNTGDALATNKCEQIMKEMIENLLPENLINAVYNEVSGHLRKEIGIIMSDLAEESPEYYNSLILIALNKVEGRQ